MQQREFVSAVARSAEIGDQESAERAGPQARRHARAVLAALKVGLTGHQYDHLASQLPTGYADLLGTEPVQHH